MRGSLVITVLLQGLPVLLSLCLLGGCTCNNSRPISRGDALPVVVVDPDEIQRVPATPEREPNDTAAQAQPLVPDDWIEGSVTAPGSGKQADLDWYRVKTPRQATILSATLAGVPGQDLMLEAMDARGKRLVKVDNNGAGGSELLVNLTVADEDVFLRVRQKPPATRRGTPPTPGQTGARGRYRLGYRLRQREAGEELEPNWKFALATPLAMDEDAVGHLGWNQDNDWYRVEVPEDLSAASRLRLEYEGIDHVQANLSLRDERGKVLQSRWSRAGGGVTLANLVLPAGAKLFYVVVRCIKAQNPEGRYYLRALASVPAGPTEREPNHKINQATPLAPGTSMAGILADNRDRDIYVVKVAEAGMIRAEVKVPLDLDVALAVVTSEGKTGWEVDNGGRRAAEVIPAFPVQPPVAYLRVRAPRRGAVSAVAPYRITARLLDDLRREREPNHKRQTANIWPGGQSTMRGHLHPQKDVDYFRLETVGEQLKLLVHPPSGMALKVELVDDSGTMVASSRQDAAFGKVRLKATIKQTDKVYYLRVSAPGMSNPDQEYQMEME